MKTTPILGLPYPELGDTPNAETGYKNLATAMDTQGNPRFSSTAARDAAIPSPIEGQLCYISNTALGLHTLMIYRGSWRRMAEAPVLLTKPSNEVVTGSTTFQADNDLFTTVEANTNYHIQALFIINTMAACGFKARFTFPVGALMAGGALATNADAGNASGISLTTWIVNSSSGGLGAGAERSSAIGEYPVGGLSQATAFTTTTPLFGYLRVGSTAGTLALEWAQVVSTGDSAELQVGSYLLVTRAN